MFEILSKYNQQGEFKFKIDTNLSLCCKTIPNINGVYTISSIINEYEMIIYIGCSGIYEVKTEKIKTRGEGKGLPDRLKAKQFDDYRQYSWPSQMQKEHFNELTIKWYNTENDIPEIVEYCLISEFKREYSRLPLWNLKNKLRKALDDKYEVFAKENGIEIIK